MMSYFFPLSCSGDAYQMNHSRHVIQFLKSCITFSVVIITVIATIGSTQYEESGKWNLTENDTEYLVMGAIGKYAPRRRNYAIDQNGKLREKW